MNQLLLEQIFCPICGKGVLKTVMHRDGRKESTEIFFKCGAAIYLSALSNEIFMPGFCRHGFDMEKIRQAKLAYNMELPYG